MIQNIDVDEGIALLGGLGALAALASHVDGSESGGSGSGSAGGTVSWSDLQERLGGTEEPTDDSDDSSNYEYEDDTEFWDEDDYDFGGPSDSDTSESTDDGPTFTNPDGTTTSPDWFGDVDDSGGTWDYEDVEIGDDYDYWGQ
jgi:hypothetical protein